MGARCRTRTGSPARPIPTTRPPRPGPRSARAASAAVRPPRSRRTAHGLAADLAPVGLDQRRRGLPVRAVQFTGLGPGSLRVVVAEHPALYGLDPIRALPRRDLPRD